MIFILLVMRHIHVLFLLFASSVVTSWRLTPESHMHATRWYRLPIFI